MKARRTPIFLILAALLVLGLSSSPAPAEGPADTTAVPAGEPPAVDYGLGEARALLRAPQLFAVNAVVSATSVIRVYKDSNAWFGENRDSATLAALGKTLGTDWFIHPISACQSGIPAGTAVVLFTSNGFGSSAARAAQNDPACQASLASFVADGGILIVDMGDNDGAGSFMAPGATGAPSLVFPSPGQDATLTAAAAGHPIVIGPDGAVGGADDLDNTNIDMCCFVAHGNLADGITLPGDATVLMTAEFGSPKPILAEYCLGGGRVILDTITKEFIGHQPPGFGPSRFLTNLLSYALSPAARCVIEVEVDIKPGSDPNSIKLSNAGVVPVAILTTGDFDASTVEPASVCFGDAEAPSERDCSESHGRGHLEDADGDGDIDLVLHFETAETGIDFGDTEACLSGETSDGTKIEGCDSVRTI